MEAGLVTGHLLDHGAPVVAVEPDPSFATLLATRFPANLHVVAEPSSEPPCSQSDACDSSSRRRRFHCVDQEVGVAKLGRILRRDRWAALW